MPVVTEVRADEAEPRRRRNAGQVVDQVSAERVGKQGAIECAGRSGDHRSEWNHVGIALRGVIDDGVEVHERVVPCRVLVGGLGDSGVVRAAQGRVGTVGAAQRVVRSTVSRWIIAHVLGVFAPGCHMCDGIRRVGGIELVGDGRCTIARGRGRREHAAVAVNLARIGRAVRVVGSRSHIEVLGTKAPAQTIRISQRCRCLAGDLRNIVVEAHVTRGVVVGEELARGDECVVEVGRHRVGAKRAGEALVLQIDDEDMVDGSRRERRPYDVALGPGDARELPKAGNHKSHDDHEGAPVHPSHQSNHR